MRDEIIGRTPKDKDWVVVNGSERELLDAGFKRVGKNFPVFLHPITKEEYALARTEKKEGLGHTGFLTNASEDITLEEDLARRDFTINAIAKDSSGKISDPFGGIKDLKRKTLRHITDAFREDPLRVLRGARFAATLGFKIANETQALMVDMVGSGELKSLSVERVERELRLAVTGHHPSYFFRTLKECDAMSQLLPELDLPQLLNKNDPVFAALKTFEGQDDKREKQYRVFLTRAEDYGLEVNERDMRVTNLIRRLKVTKDTAVICRLYRDFHRQILDIMSFREQEVFDLFEKMDAFRRPEKLTSLLEIIEIPSKPPQLFNPTKHIVEFLNEALYETKQLTAKTFFSSQEVSREHHSVITSKLKHERIKVIEPIMLRYKKHPSLINKK